MSVIIRYKLVDRDAGGGGGGGGSVGSKKRGGREGRESVMGRGLNGAYTYRGDIEGIGRP